MAISDVDPALLEYWNRRALLDQQLGTPKQTRVYDAPTEAEIERVRLERDAQDLEWFAVTVLKHRKRLKAKVDLLLWADEFGYGPVL